MITIKDIAAEADVSATTVSNVINGNHGKVSNKTIEKVQAIIDKYNYVPNMNARSLVNNNSKIIGVIIPQTRDAQNNFLQNPFNNEILSGIEQVAREKGYFVMIRCVTCYNDIYDLLKNWNVDGAIMLCIPDDDSINSVKNINTPIIFIDSNSDDKDILNIGLDDEEGSFLATSHLIENGHTNIALVAYDVNLKGVPEKRYKGYLKALQKNNIKFNPENVFEIKDNTSIDYVSSKLINNIHKFSAVFATADTLAIELMQAFKTNNIDIPNDISIVGFDNLYISKIVTPSLTTIHQDINKKGLLSCELLIDYIENKDIKPQQVILPVSLVKRESVKNILTK